MDMKTFNQQRAAQYTQESQQNHEDSGLSGSAIDHALRYRNPMSPPLLRDEPAPEEYALVRKLKLEIEQLEVWLANQEKIQQGNIPVIPTIKSLIHTRKKLLKNIQSQN